MAEFDERGLPIGEVGNWHATKHAILASYVGICRRVRGKFQSSTYIDLFCGPCRSRVRGTNDIVDGSPLVALQETNRFGVPFSQMMLGDIRPEYVDAAVTRVTEAGGKARGFPGSAEETVAQVIMELDPDGFHLAFLDPFALEPLRFSIIEKLAAVPRLDMLLHVSVMDLARNLDNNLRGEQYRFDGVAPGWRDHVPRSGTSTSRRTAFLAYWVSKMQGLGLNVARHMEIVTTEKNAQLYWLVLLSHHELAEEFWNKISGAANQGQLF